jgi:hypothetical protein
MRNELELIEKIERYLQGELTGEEKATFEEQLANEPGLQEAVQIQREVMKGIERTALKQQVKHAAKQFRLGKLYSKLAWGGLITAIVLTAVILYYKGKSHEQAGTYEGRQLPAYNEAGEKQWADADRNLPAQVFVLNTGKDTVIETRQGIVLSVPANGFTDETGRTVHGHISLVVKEALDAATIMQAGLSTTSGGQLLETGGMFFIDARQGNKILKVDPANAIYAEIPTDTIKPGMQLFTGKRNADGTIDWINPKPLEHDLIPVDILQLDFYPPKYLDSLQAWGLNVRDKTFTDSLYYSFAQFFQIKYMPHMAPVPISDSTSRPTGLDYHHDTISPANHPAIELPCGIDPAKIKAIWNEQYQNTLLATREFRERLYQIHLLGYNQLLDMYVNNLDKPLWMIDSMAVQVLRPNNGSVFETFAARRDGKVKISTRHLQQLKRYYQTKTKTFTEAIAKTQNEFWKKQATLDQQSAKKQAAYQRDSADRIANNFTGELNINLKEAWRQLGYDTIVIPRFVNTGFYSVEVTTTGWYNVDRDVIEATRNRTTVNYTDSATGKKAVIRYLPFSLQVQKVDSFDRLYAYLLPVQLNSFMRVADSSGIYLEKLNELIQYKLICIAWKGKQAFFYRQDDVEPKAYGPVVLTAIGEKELNRLLNNIGDRKQAADLLKEQTYRQFEWLDNKRQQHNLQLVGLREKIAHVIFLCYLFEEYSRDEYVPKYNQ